MPGNIDLTKLDDHASELGRARFLHELFSAQSLLNDSSTQAELYRRLSPMLKEGGVFFGPATFLKTLAKWRKDPRPKALVRMRERRAVKPAQSAELERAAVLHEALSAAVQPGKHINRAALFRTLSPLLSAAGYQIGPRTFSIIFNKWRKDPRPETLTRVHPVRHRSSAKSNVRLVREYAIKNGITLRAAWTHFSESRVAGLPAFQTVLTGTPDAASVDQFAQMVLAAENTKKRLREQVRALESAIKATCVVEIKETRERLLSLGK